MLYEYLQFCKVHMINGKNLVGTLFTLYDDFVVALFFILFFNIEVRQTHARVSGSI